MSSKTTLPGVRETIPNPYATSSFTAPGYQQPLGFINLRNQAQGSQPTFITSPGIFASNQLGPGNTQMVNPATGIAATNFKEDAKALGGIQIVIGSMHIGFGIILGLMSYSADQNLGFASISFIGGYPFWGGLQFIISGSLSISASSKFSPCLIKSSLGMNIVSSIFALVGVILLLVDMIINDVDNQAYCTELPGKGISAMLMIFSLLEFCVTCATAHFANQTIANTNRSVLVIPTVYSANPLTTETSSTPPRNDNDPAYDP
ncbi:PREDICTED: membrane-spanning 4-domains subfamily A member 12, partial [Galeopterus variegatus]|uniref:Membrane-spanning 4-domains subfamily A member 12 n=1 Tax=Galeopterus variegatus TaxID=482537 RepID=A0ABM0SBQ3_GALVR